MNKQLFTLSIPTYNRPEYLDICLNRILISFSKLDEYDQSLIEILVSDNSENNLSTAIISQKKYKVLNISYIKNETNIGSDQNLANCYIKSNGEYVSLMGDDDFIEDDYFQEILPIIKKMQYSIIFLKFYGYTFSANEKRPEINQQNIVFKTSADALIHRNIHICFISGLIFRKNNISDEVINSGVGTNLVQVNACFNILNELNKESIYLPMNLVGCSRNNTGGYNPVKVFFENYFNLLSNFNNLGLKNKQLEKLKNKMLYTFYSRNFAQYMRNNNSGLSNNDLISLDKSFHKNYLYRFFIRRAFQVYSRLNFNLLSIIYIFSNIFYYPSRIADFLKHMSNLVKNYKNSD